jgi:hypothetical protein
VSLREPQDRNLTLTELRRMGHSFVNRWMAGMHYPLRLFARSSPLKFGGLNR